jgi:hypothetical protein
MYHIISHHHINMNRLLLIIIDKNAADARPLDGHFNRLISIDIPHSLSASSYQRDDLPV